MNKNVHVRVARYACMHACVLHGLGPHSSVRPTRCAAQMIETRYHLNPDRFNTLQKLVLTEKEDKVTASENSTTSLMWFKRYGRAGWVGVLGGWAAWV